MTTAEQRANEGSISVGRKPKKYAPATAVDLREAAPDGQSCCRFVYAVTAGDIVLEDEDGDEIAFPAVPAYGPPLVFAFSALKAGTTATVVVGW